MLLALDLGNSALKGGLFENAELVRTFSVEPPDVSLAERTSTHWIDVLSPALENVDVDRVGLASVVPSSTDPVVQALQALTAAPVTTLHTEMPLPFILDYDTPHTLGTDRLAAAAGGWVHHGRGGPRSVLVVDVGTAINYEVVHRDGVYQGGAIGAGPALVQRTLRRGTAQLPDVPLTLPDEPVGQSTRAALQSGIVWGLVDSVSGMTDRLAQSLPDTPVLVLTGGWSALLTDYLDQVDHHAPHLVLRGVRLLATRND